ncbi:MAG: NAD(P)-binding domain-containing protein, partial [Opitutae bacterium]|nr:NAD(P)-binding domain-containing protein [Opitutae bacterium]
MPAKVYTQKEAKVTSLRKKTLAVIGYGSQGHAHALNLKESGCKVIIGLYKGSKSIRVAKRHGFEVVDVAEATRQADVIMIGVPDMKQAEVYENEIKPNLSKGKTLLFTHGFAIHFGLIKPPRGVSVIMVAPKGPGHIVRSQYKEGKGVPALIAVLKGSAKTSKDVALAWAAGI